MHVGPRALHRIELLLGVGEEGPAASVDDERDLVLAAFAGNVESRCHECRGQVVEHVVAEVLEDLDRLRLARAGEPCDDDEVRLTRSGQSGRIHERTRATTAITTAARKAATKPSTWNPIGGIAETSNSISALITKWKSPSVRHVIGIAMSEMIGRTKALTIPRTRPARRSEIHLSASP